MSTFGTFTMARLGIFVAQHALNTTGNNISNINTEGYTRQKLDQTSMTYGAADRYQSTFDVRSNGGVLATGVDQMRDQYLDIRYRNEMTRVGEMEAKSDGLSQLAVIFDEVNKGEDGEGVLEARFNNLGQQLETMLQDYNVGRNTNDSIVREAAEELAIQFNDYAKQLETLETTMTAEFKDNVTSVNTTLTKIRDLNEAIRRAQIFGGSAMTQRDERNLLIDDLSKQIGINVIYEMEDLGDGVEVEKLRIETAGDPANGIPSRTLIDGIYGAQLSIVQEGTATERDNGDNTSYTVIDGKDNANFDIVISQLEDARGKAMATQPNDPKPMIGSFETVGDPKAQPTAGVIPAMATPFDTAAKANIAANLLNSDPTYYLRPDAVEGETPAKAYYYHVADANGNSVNEKGSDTYDSSMPESKPPYYIHIHETTYAPQNRTGKTDAEIEQIEKDELAARAGYSGDSITHYAFADVKVMNGTRLGDTELAGGLQAQRELLTEQGEYATDETVRDIDPEAGAKRGIPYYRKALDTLARTFAEAMNEANRLTDDIIYKTNADGEFLTSDNTTVATSKSQYVLKDEYKKYFKQTVDGNGDTVFADKDGNPLSAADQNDPTKYVVADDYKKYFGGNLFSVGGTTNQDGTNGDDPGTEKITAANISISYDWAHGSLHVLTSISPYADTTSRASDNLAHIVSMFGEKHEFTTGTNTQGITYFRGTFQEMLTDTIAGTLAKDQNITETMLDNYNATADTLYVDRDAVMGVDLNDEAMNMMQFQKAYSAACRLMTTYDEMLEKLINGTAI